jgi:hypothetical protein
MPLTQAERDEACTLLHERDISLVDLALVELEFGVETGASDEIVQDHIKAGHIVRDRFGRLNLTTVGKLKAQAARPYRNVLADLVGA